MGRDFLMPYKVLGCLGKPSEYKIHPIKSNEVLSKAFQHSILFLGFWCPRGTQHCIVLLKGIPSPLILTVKGPIIWTEKQETACTVSAVVWNIFKYSGNKAGWVISSAWSCCLFFLEGYIVRNRVEATEWKQTQYAAFGAGGVLTN